MEVRCPSCQALLALADSAAGKRALCPSCETNFRVPPAEPFHGVEPSPRPEATHPPLIRCPACDQTLAYGPSIAGQTIICPTCQRRLQMPTSGERVVDLGHAQTMEPAGPWSRPRGPTAGYPREENPYSPLPSLPADPAAMPRSSTNYALPGTFLVALSGLALFSFGLNLLRFVAGVAFGGAMIPGPAQLLFTFFFLGLAGLSHVATFVGGMHMIRQRRLDLAKLGAVAALYPCGFCFVLQIPFAIWALVILNSSSAAADFSPRSDLDASSNPAPRRLY